MKTLRLTLLMEPEMSVADLAGLFGDFTWLSGVHRYIEFKFDNIKMLTGLQLQGICKLLESYEGVQPFKFKMFHLFDDTNQSYSPIRLECWSGEWQVINADTSAQLNKSRNLLTLI